MLLWRKTYTYLATHKKKEAPPSVPPSYSWSCLKRGDFYSLGVFPQMCEPPKAVLAGIDDSPILSRLLQSFLWFRVSLSVFVESL